MQPDADFTRLPHAKRPRVPGSGRKLGTPNLRTVRQLSRFDGTDGKISPLEIMVAVMRAHWERGDEKAAFFSAIQCAPYLHARLSAVAVDATVRLDPKELTNQQLAAIVGKAVPTLEHGPVSAPDALVELEALASAVAADQESDGQP